MKFNTQFIWAIAFLLYIAALAWLCFGSFTPGPDVPREWMGLQLDKCVHFLMFMPSWAPSHSTTTPGGGPSAG